MAHDGNERKKNVQLLREKHITRVLQEFYHRSIATDDSHLTRINKTDDSEYTVYVKRKMPTKCCSPSSPK